VLVGAFLFPPPPPGGAGGPLVGSAPAGLGAPSHPAAPGRGRQHDKDAEPGADPEIERREPAGAPCHSLRRMSNTGIRASGRPVKTTARLLA